MSYDDDFYPQRITMAELRDKAAKAVTKLRKMDKHISPISPLSGVKIARSFWGQAWCRNIELYRDLDYRLQRGRSYLRCGAVVDLRISEKKVTSKVIGSELYDVEVTFAELESASWQFFIEKCTGEIDSIVDLLAGKLPSKVSKLISDETYGLFPKSHDIKFNCNCLDDADMCKHVAATLYGVGVHFDQDPHLFFLLRGVDPKDLIRKASAGIILAEKETVSHAQIEDLFGIELDDDSSWQQNRES